MEFRGGVADVGAVAGLYLGEEEGACFRDDEGERELRGDEGGDAGGDEVVEALVVGAGLVGEEVDERHGEEGVRGEAVDEGGGDDADDGVLLRGVVGVGGQAEEEGGEREELAGPEAVEVDALVADEDLAALDEEEAGGGGLGGGEEDGVGEELEEGELREARGEGVAGGRGGGGVGGGAVLAHGGDGEGETDLGGFNLRGMRWINRHYFQYKNNNNKINKYK